MPLFTTRDARQKEHDNIRVLPRALRGRHLHHHDQETDAVLLLQPDRAVRADLLHGPAWVHSTSRLGRETHTRSV